MGSRLSSIATRSVVLGALIGAGCTSVGPDYERPGLPVKSPSVRGQVGTAEARSLADLPWWDVFKDDALRGLVKEALENNQDLEAAVARIATARERVRIAEADASPQLEYGAVSAREKVFFPEEDQDDGNQIVETFGTALNATWEMDLWGRVRRSSEAARARLFAEEFTRRGVLLALVSDVASGYFRLVGLDRELAIAQESASMYQRTLELFTTRFDAGRDSKLSVARVRANHADSLVRIATVKRTILQQENALSILLGANPRRIERGMALADQQTPETPVGMTEDLLERRPDVREAEQAMIAANAEIGVAAAEFYPKVGLSGAFGARAGDSGEVFDPDFDIWRMAAAVTGPLFQGGRLRANYRAREAHWDEVTAVYRGRVLTALRETSDALAERDTLVEQRAALQTRVEALREAVDLALIRYDGGRATYFEVLEAQQQLYPAEDALARTQRDQLVAVVNLYKALGGGWKLRDSEWVQPTAP